jgi:tRNA(fMet)-specific endonuclease VapC
MAQAGRVVTFRYMLDTDICVHLLRRHAPPALERRFREASAEIALSTIALSELRVGLGKRDQTAQSQDRFYRLIDGLLIADFDPSAAEHAADIRCDLESLGRKIGPLDTLIAGHARSAGAVLVTGNLREFSRVSGLRCEDWLSASGFQE